MLQKDETGPVFFCDLAALAPQERERHQRVLHELRSTVEELRETADGYAFWVHPVEAFWHA